MHGDEDVARETRVRVSVHLPGGLHCRDSAKVTLRQGELTYDLGRPSGSLLYEGLVRVGTYVLEVGTKDLVSPPREVIVPEEGKTASAYLGKPGWPFYRLGENAVPFEPRDDLLAVAFDSGTPDPKAALEHVKRLRAELGLVPFPVDQKRPRSFVAAKGAIWLFKVREAPWGPNMAEKIVAVLGREARIGVPVDLVAGQVSVLDNRFVVRFRDGVSVERIEAMLEAAKARTLRTFLQADNARLIEFRRGRYDEHLAALERWLAAGYLIYGEPDLLSELTDDTFPATPPNDKKYGKQKSLRLQGVDLAWRYLHGIDKDLTLGSPEVCVATLDTGVETSHADVGGQLTDGTSQLAFCYDFEQRLSCGSASYEADYHGMGVYGIVAARTNNGKGISGIAPNTRQLALKKPNLLSATYPDVLLWAAGFVTGRAKPWPPEPNAQPADIINCSHGRKGLALSGLMDDTLKYLAKHGRKGLGTVVVYAAGNSSTPRLITGYLTWAAHPKTVAVTNSNPLKAGIERINAKSNFGPEADLCAQGEGSWSLTLEDEGSTRKFGGTSAAAPMVSAAAALMLSVNPGLKWSDVRDLLRAKAKKRPDGVGRPGEWSGTFSEYYGHGRLDVDASVQAAHALVP